MNTEERIKQLERQVQELASWKNERQRQQLTYPLDSISKDVVNGDFLRVVNEINFVQPSGKEIPMYVVARANGKNYTLTANSENFTFTAATSDVITSSASFDFVNDMTIAVFTNQVLPAGLIADTLYYVINASGKTCKLSLTSGGAAIDITSTGTGIQYFYFI